MATFEIRWQAPEFEYHVKDVGWYWLSIIAAVLVLGAAIWQKNFLFGFFVVVAEILILFWGGHEPEMVWFVLNEKGLAIGEQKIYHINEIESFSVDERAEWPVIAIRFHRHFRPIAKITVSKDKMPEVHKQLRLMFPQVEHQDSLVDTLEKFLGF